MIRTGIKNKEILRLLKIDIQKSKHAQSEIAEKLGISSAFLSRQLNGHDPMHSDRAYEIEKILVHAENQKRVHELLKEELGSTAEQEINMESLLEFGKNDRRTVLMTMLRMILPDLSINGLRSVTLHAETVLYQEHDPVLIRERIKHAEAELEYQEALLKQLVPISDQFGKNASQVQYSITVTEVNIRDLQERIRNWKELAAWKESCDMSHLN